MTGQWKEEDIHSANLNGHFHFRQESAESRRNAERGGGKNNQLWRKHDVLAIRAVFIGE